MSLNIYVASSWRNDHYPAIVDDLRELGHTVFDFRHPAPGDDGFRWSEIDPEWNSWSIYDYRRSLLHPAAQRGYAFDKAGLDNSNVCVLVMPCGRSAHLEAGYMIGQGKQTIMHFPIGVRAEPELMYLLSGMITTFDNELCEALEYIDGTAAQVPSVGSGWLLSS